MPSYDYRCQECKDHFTVERSMTDESKQCCVSCGSENASRIWTVFMTAMNGSTPDYGQGASTTTSTTATATKSACSTCVSKACGTCN